MSEDEFRVEKIVDQKVEDGIKKYLVKWEGYNDDDNTWDDVKALESIQGKVHVQKLIDDYEKSLLPPVNGNAVIDNLAEDEKTEDEDENATDEEHEIEQEKEVPPKPQLSDENENTTDTDDLFADSPKPPQQIESTRTAVVESTEEKENDSDPDDPNYQAEGYEIEKILGLLEEHKGVKEKHFLIVWTNGNHSIVPSSIANARYPQEIILFYQRIVKFKPENSGDVQR